MAKGNEQGIVGMITDSLRKEGPMFLFKGWLPAWSESPSECVVLDVGANDSPVDSKHSAHVCLFGTTEKWRRLCSIR